MGENIPNLVTLSATDILNIIASFSLKVTYFTIHIQSHNPFAPI
jgi:hypothetical protein